jgi:hypothetical protein
MATMPVIPGPCDRIRLWWDRLLPDEQAQILAARWEPVSGWARQSLVQAGLPPALDPDGYPGAYLPTDVHGFLERLATKAPGRSPAG